MPTYEYSCTACGHSLDIVHKMSDPSPTDCPKCGKPSLERLVSNSAFVLKGAGWYSDGYGASKSKDGSSSKAGGGAASDSAKSGDGAAPTPDAKPETAKTPAPAKKDDG